MKKGKKTILLTVLCICMAALFTGCSKVQTEAMTSLVKWDLDSVYLNQHDEKYLEMCGLTKEEAEENYVLGVEYEASFFAYYWGITDEVNVTYTDLEEELQNSIYEICDTLSKSAKYEVKSSAKQEDGTYSVKVTVEPIDVMERAYGLYDSDEAVNAFFAKTENVDYETISDEEYLALCNEYGYIIVDLVKGLIPDLGYLEAKSLNIQVEEIDNLWTLNEDDMASFNEYYISYPY